MSDLKEIYSLREKANKLEYNYLYNLEKQINSNTERIKNLEEVGVINPPDPPDPSPTTKIYGYGKDTKGGEGGRIIYVTNLNNSGEGSLRWAIDQSGKRTIKSKIDGRINVTETLAIENGEVTIDFEDRNITLSMEGTPNEFVLRISAPEVIVRFLTIRRSLQDVSSKNSDCVYIGRGHNIVLQNCSFSWASDELIGINPEWADRDTKGVYNVTIQDCLFGFTYGDKGILISGGASEISIIRPVFASTKTRTPAISTPTDRDYSFDCYFEVINPLIYDTSTGFTYQINKSNPEGTFYLNLIGGTEFQNEGGGYSRNMMTIKQPNLVYAYLEGNEGNFGTDWDLVQFGNGQSNINKPVPNEYRLSEPVDTPALAQGIEILKANELVEKLLPTSGNYLPQRDSEDERAINDIINKTQTYKDVNVFPY